MDENEELKQLYQLYLTNQCSPAELKRFFVLINNSKDDQTILDLMSASWDQTQGIPETGLVPDFLPKETKQVKLSPVQLVHYHFRYVAAVMLLLTGLYFFRSTVWNVVSPAHQLESITSHTERRQLELPDGTKVWLSPNSKLKYPNQFRESNRIVRLDGEAFFEVAHDARRPFIIQSGKVNTRVLGTSFNISAYPQQAEISVTLVTGKVAVALQKENSIAAATITANQRISVNKAEGRISKMDFPHAGDYLNRRLGIFEYKEAILAEVIKDIELQYQIRIQLSPELNRNMFYGNLDMTKPLTQTLNKLCTVMETNWKEDGGQYVVTK